LARLVHDAAHKPLLALENAEALAEAGFRIVEAEMTAGIALRLLGVLGPRGEDLVRLLADEPDAAIGTDDDHAMNLPLRVDALQHLAAELLHVDDALHEELALLRIETQQPGIAAVARGADVHLAIQANVDGGIARAVRRRPRRREHDEAGDPRHVLPNRGGK